MSDFYKEIIADELNVKEVVFTNDTKDLRHISLSRSFVLSDAVSEAV